MNVIEIKDLSKTFYTQTSGINSFRSYATKIFTYESPNRKKIEALKNINFEVKQGDFFGIIGRNGSGKSTLLNIIIGALKPDKESILVTRGKMIRLALGMGFDPNLSARDNIYVNASILGLTFKRIGLIFDDVVGFAELEEFVDVPVKHFSSGMMSKLKFAIAVHAEADIFLMDEFFGGVGDESFRAKSQKVFENTFLDGRTIIHVSHSMHTIKAHCNKVLLLNKGEQLMTGAAEDVINKYYTLFPKIKR